MRALILSDIHGNLNALEAVLAGAPPHDTVWNLGDLVGYGAQPNEVVTRAQELGTVFVRGNHDRAASGLISPDSFNPIAAQAVRWTERQLTAEHIGWLQSLPRGPVEVAIRPPGQGGQSKGSQAKDRKITCVHGSILDEDEYVLSVDDAVGSLRRSPTRINFFGHTHRQGGFATNDEDWFTLKPVYADEEAAECWELPLRPGVRYLLNPGSVGQPRDGDWRSGFAVCDLEKRVVEFYRVPYDIRAAQARILEAGLPDRLASRLRQGR